MKIYIASDHGGFELKQEILKYLTSPSEDTLVELTQIEGVEDMGPTEYIEGDDYPDYAASVGEKISQDPDSLGILLCRSGNGMVIAANKFKGVYAALCFTEQHAKKAREDDNANVLCLDSDYKDGDSPQKIVHAFLKSKFSDDERFVRRFYKIKELEDDNFVHDKVVE